MGSKINDFKTFSCHFFYCLSLDHSIVSRDLKNFLQVFRNMPDTLLKFGGIWFRRFRDLEFHKSKNSGKHYENQWFSRISLRKFIKENKFFNLAIAWSRNLAKGSPPNFASASGMFRTTPKIFFRSQVTLLRSVEA